MGSYALAFLSHDPRGRPGSRCGHPFPGDFAPGPAPESVPRVLATSSHRTGAYRAN